MKKHLSILFVILFLTGCASYERRINLSPQDSFGWERIHERYYRTGCNTGEVEVKPIVLGVEGEGQTFFFVPIPSASQGGSDLIKQKGAWTYLTFESDRRIDSCELSFVTLRDNASGKEIRPIDSETTVYPIISGKYSTGCRYYFDLNEIKKEEYSLIISKKVFNCRIEPILYEYEKARQTFMMQMM